MPSLSLRRIRTHLEVLENRHAREDPPAFRNLDDALRGDLVRPVRPPIFCALELDGALLWDASWPEMVFSVVDLPAPFAPMSVTISPSLTSIEMPLSASILP